jgi:hypothetical protein
VPTPDLPAGVTALGAGTVSLTGPALAWLHQLDATVVQQATRLGSREVGFPPLIAAADLSRLDYFRSFPHLVTLPVALTRDRQGMQRFVDRCSADPVSVPLVEHAPIEHALLPAACYPVYSMFERARLTEPALLTTRATCFRREEHFEPLRRQWAFSMREVVYVGDVEGVAGFLAAGTALVDRLCDRLGLAREWLTATDPFFEPARSGRSLYQRLSPVKWEASVDDLAVASLNRHHEHFADAFDIAIDGSRAQTACLAFGLERWLGVMAARWGRQVQHWPAPSLNELTHA